MELPSDVLVRPDPADTVAYRRWIQAMAELNGDGDQPGAATTTAHAPHSRKPWKTALAGDLPVAGCME
ncbi:hypothetical protein [Catellatospora sp. NPDC049133]|uniref:hypothetical protein n=1 Tax=Catellatospora sp. NPDC049133 TaxID=3155499 RepID=UPI003400ACCC